MNESKKLIDNILSKNFTGEDGAMDNFDTLLKQQLALKLPEFKNKVASQIFKPKEEE